MEAFFTKTRILLIALLLFAAFLRFWQLGMVPPTASLDEASIGYNAYSVSKIGVDEYGQFPFVSQRGYDDWRRSTYLLLTVPFIRLLGLNVVAERLPAVFLSILTIWATYRIVLLLFSRRSSLTFIVAFLTAFLLAISPWHVYISRLGHESNACLSFLILAILFFLEGRKNKSGIMLSMIFFTLSMISYYSGQAFVPLFLFGLLIIFRKELFLMAKTNKKILSAFVIFPILLIPVLWTLFSPAAMVRFQGTSTFTSEAHWEMFQKRVQLWNKAVADNDIIGTILYNRHLYPLQVFLEGYVSHFRPSWLFTNSGSEPFKIPNIGLLYPWEIPFIIIGMLAFLGSRDIDPKAKRLVFLWFFLAPLPAAIATQAPHAMRSYNFLPTWQIFTAFGLMFLFSKLRKFQSVGTIVFVIVVILSLTSLYRNYFIVFPREQSRSFQYALSKAIPFALSKQDNYKTIVFSNKDNLYQSYMFVLFYSRYDPASYVKLGGTKSGGFAETHKFDRYLFRPINWAEDAKLKNTLFVGNPSDFSASVTPLKVFNYLDGSPGVALVEGI